MFYVISYYFMTVSVYYDSLVYFQFNWVENELCKIQNVSELFNKNILISGFLPQITIDCQYCLLSAFESSTNASLERKYLLSFSWLHYLSRNSA